MTLSSIFLFRLPLKSQVQDLQKICILDIDIQGVQQVKSSVLQCKYIFIAPPSLALLEERLRNRGTETEQSIVTRLGQSSNEITYGETEGNFDAFITNHDLETAYNEIIYYLQYWYPHHNFGFEPQEWTKITHCITLSYLILFCLILYCIVMLSHEVLSCSLSTYWLIYCTSYFSASDSSRVFFLNLFRQKKFNEGKCIHMLDTHTAFVMRYIPVYGKNTSD